LSIGAVSRATGIPVETLRTWEQRYGFPVPERRPSGHRVYNPSVVPRLRRIHEAVTYGCRTGDAVCATDSELSDLLSSVPHGANVSPLAQTGARRLEELLEAVRAFDGERLRRMLLHDWAALGPVNFLEHCAGPLVQLVGDHWSRGELQIRHEHFLSERLSDLLRLLRAPFDERAVGAPVILATLPGEQHALGLQMAALAIAAAGARALYLGQQTPAEQIAALAAEMQARAVALSVSAAASPDVVDHALTELRARLPAAITIIVGGAGAPAAREGVQRVTTFRELTDLVPRLRTR
jgi:DNA-binding transcriptional MerR regulator